MLKTPAGAAINLSEEEKTHLSGIYNDFSMEDALWVKDKEKETNHDLKSVEYFAKHKM